MRPSSGPKKVSDELEHWLGSDGEKTLGSLIEVFEEKSFAIFFVVLLGVPTLPLPTGGATHVFEAILAPPFTGLDTLPALGVMLLSLGVLLEDFVVVVVALIVGSAHDAESGTGHGSSVSRFVLT